MTDSAKNGSARVAGVEAPKHEDKETTISELKTRITETVAFLKTIDETAFNAGADKQIVFPLGKLYKGAWIQIRSATSRNLLRWLRLR